jgi:hypothetical protein
MRLILVLSLALVAVVVPPGAAASVHLISISAQVRAGSYASLAVSDTPPALCSIRVQYRSRHPLRGVGLTASRGTFGVIHWRWKMPTGATAGRWTVDVLCGQSGALHSSFVVR